LSAFSSLQAIGGGLYVFDNGELGGLDGLENLTTVGDRVVITDNDQLSSLAALSNLTSIGAYAQYAGVPLLSIHSNPSLSGCWVWMLEAQTGEPCEYEQWHQGPIEECFDNLGQGSCGTLPPDFECVAGAVGPGVFDGDLVISGNPFMSDGPALNELGGLTCVTGELWLDDPGSLVVDLHELSGLKAVGRSLAIYNATDLQSLTGLENLESVGHALRIADNPVLASLAGLSNLTSLGEAEDAPEPPDPLYVFNNAVLPECWVGALETQTDTVCGYTDFQSGFIECMGNDGTTSCDP
jgi:hypothetical protein